MVGEGPAVHAATVVSAQDVAEYDAAPGVGHVVVLCLQDIAF
jgi:hypothetical protein